MYASDIGFKENIKDFSDSALDHVKNTRVRKYQLKQDNPNERDRIGLIRQEAPDQLHAGEESLDLYQMCSMLWKSVQELADKVSSSKRKGCTNDQRQSRNRLHTRAGAGFYYLLL